MIQFDEHIFQMGWFNHQLVVYRQCLHMGVEPKIGVFTPPKSSILMVFSMK